MPENQDAKWQEGVDSRALLALVLRRLPVLLVVALAGAAMGVFFSFLTALAALRSAVYVSETEYYIQFAEGRYEAKDYYNDFTWNDVIATDLILGRAMEFLAPEYTREQVRAAVTADILSDVRYLTITVRAAEPQRAASIADALQTALEEFGDTMEEFAAIYQIEDLGVVKEQIPVFTWRAAALGAGVFVGIALFVIILRFCVGSSFYTKGDIAKAFGVPVCGIVFAGKNGQEELVQWQRGQFLCGMQRLQSQCGKLYLLDGAQGQDASVFLRMLESEKDVVSQGIALYGMGQYDNAEGANILLVIPFGVRCRERIADEIENARMHGGTIVGAVLTGMDRLWARLYYGSVKARFHHIRS